MTLSSSLQILMVMAIGKTVGAAAGMFLSDWIGRKPSIVAIRVAVRGASVSLWCSRTALVHRNQLHARGDTRHRQHRRIHRLRSGAVRDALSAARHRALRRGRTACDVRGAVPGGLSLRARRASARLSACWSFFLIVEAIVIQLFGDETRQVSLEAAAPADIREMRSTGLPSIEPVKS